MKKMYFSGVTKNIKAWIEKNGQLEYSFWTSDEDVLQNEDGTYYTDMPFILEKLINDMMRAGLAISEEMRKPIFSVLVRGESSIATPKITTSNSPHSISALFYDES